MNMIDTLIAIVVIGIITTFFSYVPTSTIENMTDANKVINYTDLLDDVSYKIEKTKWEEYSTDEAKENKANELILQAKTEEKEYLGDKYKAKGEVVEIDGKKFVKVWIQDKKIYQEYFFGIQ